MPPTTTQLVASPSVNRALRKSIAYSFAAACVLVMALASHTSAQTFRGTILGTVTDPNGAVVPGATVNQVETTNTTLGGTISFKEVQDLPVNGRDFTKFLVMVPGATGDPSGATDSPGSFGLFSANGNRGRANNFLLDGTDMNDGYRNLPAINEAGVFGTPATILPIEAISEAAILSNFEAEYGRNSGAIINIVTKSGTNDFHGY